MYNVDLILILKIMTENWTTNWDIQRYYSYIIIREDSLAGSQWFSLAASPCLPTPPKFRHLSLPLIIFYIDLGLVGCLSQEGVCPLLVIIDAHFGSDFWFSYRRSSPWSWVMLHVKYFLCYPFFTYLLQRLTTEQRRLYGSRSPFNSHYLTFIPRVGDILGST